MSNTKKFFVGLKNFFTISGLKKFFSLLNKKEKIFFFIFIFFFFSSSSFLITNFYFKHSEFKPVKGGEIFLGEVGFPTFFNPIYSLASDADDSVVQLLFSGLMKYQEKEIVSDLVEKYQILEEGKVFEFSLKDNIFWSDDTPITADDVVFTVKTIQNPEVKSPLRPLWLGVEVEKISEKSFRFLLKNPSAVFLENCTLKIIPKHLWERIPPANFPLSYLNLETVSSGPYKIGGIQRDKDGKIILVSLIENEKYFGKKPFIPIVNFLFFESENELINAAKEGKIDGFSLTKPEEINGFRILNFKLPRYFAVFFNLEKKLFSIKEVRKALNYGTDKKEIVKEVFLKKGVTVDSPILPEIFGLKKNEKNYYFDFEKANEILKKIGFEDLDGNGVKEKIEIKEPAFQFKSELKVGSHGKEVEELQRCLAKDPQIYPNGEITGYFGPKTKEAVIKFQEKYKKEILEPFNLEKGNGIVKEKTQEKLNEICFEKKEEKIVLEFELKTVNQPMLLKTAEILKEQWKRLGFEVKIKELEINELKRDVLPKKDYEALLFGEALGLSIDLFPFWHSSQRGEIGLNLANYQNKKVDEILEQTRKFLDEKKRKENLETLQEILIEDSPAIFLFNPDYLYFISEKINGMEPKIIFSTSGKFLGIENWYVKTKRIIK